MNHPILVGVSALLISMTSACDNASTPDDGTETTAETAAATDVLAETANPLLADFAGPYGGVPAFDKMDLAAVKPALEKGMALTLAEIDEIAGNPEPPTFKGEIQQKPQR